MKRININTGSEFEKIIGFSRAVRIENFICVSGTAPVDQNGRTVAVGDLFLQTMRCFDISKKAILLAGGSLDHVVRTRIYLKDISEWRQAAKAHKEFFNSIQPSCTILEVQRFIHPDWLVETEMDCYLSKND